MIRAMEFMAESTPMTIPLRVGGTHCMSKMGIAGVKSGNPATYMKALGGIKLRLSCPIAMRPADTSDSPSTVVRVSPKNLCTGANKVAETTNDTAESAVRSPPIAVGLIARLLDNKSGKKESNVDCPEL